MENAVISNKFAEVCVSTMGAEILSVRSRKGTEFMWSGKKEVWTGHAPVLFPICGGLKEDKFIYDGREYILPKHGFAKKSLFECESRTDSSMVMILKSNENTLKMYPFEFEFRVKYELIDNTLRVSYMVTNCSDRTMYYSVGAHEAYACPEGIENYTVKFENNVNLTARELLGNLLGDNTTEILKNSKELALKKDYFKIDALVFKDIDFDKASLCANDGSRKITVKFPNHRYFLLWTKYVGGDYMCMEPWCGIQDSVHTDCKLSAKEGIMSLEANKTKETYHEITFED